MNKSIVKVGRSFFRFYTEVNVSGRIHTNVAVLFFLPSDFFVSRRYIPAIVDHTGCLPCQGTFLLHQVLMKTVEQQVSSLQGIRVLMIDFCLSCLLLSHRAV